MPNGRTTKLAYKVYWCLSALKAVGRTDNSTRGVWSLTDAGQQVSEADLRAVRDQITSYYREANRKRKAQRDAAEPTAGSRRRPTASNPATRGRTSCSGRCARWSRWRSSDCASGCCASRASSASPSRRPAGTAASTAWACWRSACSPSRRTSSASATPTASAPAPCGISAAPWPAGERRAHHHHGHLHQRGASGSHARWCAADRPHRRRPPVRSTQTGALGCQRRDGRAHHRRHRGPRRRHGHLASLVARSPSRA